MYLSVDGLIPARAGNTRANLGECAYEWAHPRSRGEHMKALGFFLIVWGSSPLARGTPFGIELDEKFSGLIPARAGNT